VWFVETSLFGSHDDIERNAYKICSNAAEALRAVGYHA
jgi:hypothetical protein